MSFLISKCCNETISSVFDRCFSENLHFYYELCKIGIELGCAVAHHKFAALLIHNLNQKIRQLNITMKYIFLKRKNEKEYIYDIHVTVSYHA